MRLDVFLVQKGWFPSRQKARKAIDAGWVIVNGKPVPKAGTEITLNDVIEVSPNELLKYVSAGGFKLEKAILDFQLDFRGKTILDIGASTGGFTDCALQHGAVKVYTVDVGTDQLSPQLKKDSRVIWHEQTHIKDFTLAINVDVVLMDVSFMSQVLVYPLLKNWLKPQGWVISLIKPQFELNKKISFRRGIIRDEQLHQQVLNKIIDEAAKHNLMVQKITTAPESEQKNKEFLAWFIYQPAVQ
ncbi:MAG: TlyA family RNA methyltransferase [Flavobacteriales bacterium]|nr:TlyA family RNA methyltransferase [Flavobacteriales bacterium]